MSDFQDAIDSHVASIGDAVAKLKELEEITKVTLREVTRILLLQKVEAEAWEIELDIDPRIPDGGATDEVVAIRRGVQKGD